LAKTDTEKAINVVNLLIVHGADPEQLSSKGYTPVGTLCLFLMFIHKLYIFLDIAMSEKFLQMFVHLVQVHGMGKLASSSCAEKFFFWLLSTPIEKSQDLQVFL
jgi:hypothetical protein